MSSNYELYEEGQEFDVFLSFRGDIRKGFISHLYYGLHNAKVRVFKDNVSLPTGEVIRDELVRAIKHSKISIPILSQNYAHSKWCLMELSLMMECRTTTNQIVLPIFYDVAPRDVRHQTGTYKDAFYKHAMDHGQDTVTGWRKALSDVGQLKGPTPSDTKYGDEAELVRTVVADVMERLKKTQVTPAFFWSTRLFSKFQARRVNVKVVSNAAESPTRFKLGSLLEQLENQVIPRTDHLSPAELHIHALNYKQKYIFLNMACFWIGKMRCGPDYIWADQFEGSVSYEIRRLESDWMFSIKIKDNRYWMDDEHRDLARAFVKTKYNYTAGKQIWLWSSREATQLLMENKLLPQVEAICLDGDQLLDDIDDKCFKAKQLRNLSKLKFIEILSADLAGNFEGALQQVSYLKVDGPFQQTIQNLSLENIVVLSLSYSGVEDDWKWSTNKASLKMKYLNLSNCHQLIRGPNLSMFPNLERLSVTGCEQLVSMVLGDLRSLKALDASKCKSMQHLYGLQWLESLEWLDIAGCKMIKSLPDLSNLKKLRILNAQGCISLQRLEGVERLQALRELNIVGCASIKHFPDITNLKELKPAKFRTSETEKIKRRKELKFDLFIIFVFCFIPFLILVIIFLILLCFGLFFRYIYISFL